MSHFKLSKGQNIVFDFPPPFSIQENGHINDFESNIQVKVIKKKLSAKEKERKKLNIMFYKFGRTVALAVMLFALGMIGEQIYGYVHDYEHSENIKKMYDIGIKRADVTPERKIPIYPKSTPARLDYPGSIASKDKLQELKNASDDFRFWLYVDGTTINYYVLQTVDNEFYLRRDIYKNFREGSAGSIFLDYRNRVEKITGNKKNEIGSNNILYGHNVKNGTMFGSLKEFQKKEHFFKHQYIYTYSTEGVTVWKIFSSYETTTDDYYIQTYFSSPSEFLEFARNLQKKSVIDTDIILTSRDDILTLSTCHKYNNNNGRFVVHAVKLGTAPIN